LESSEAIFHLAILFIDLELKRPNAQKLLQVLSKALHPEIGWGLLWWMEVWVHIADPVVKHELLETQIQQAFGLGVVIDVRVILFLNGWQF